MMRAATGMIVATMMLAAPTCAVADQVYDVDTEADLVDATPGDGSCRTSANTCSLRAAVMQSNSQASFGVTIIALPAGTFRLTIPPTGADGESTGDLNLAPPIGSGQVTVIVGSGARTTILDGNHASALLRIEAGRQVIVDGVTIRNGLSAPPNYDGGGIANLGTLTLTNSVVENNVNDGKGAGIFSLGTLTVQATTIRNNRGDVGGGIYAAGTATVRDATIHGNGSRYGGGIYAYGNVYVVNSTVSDNYADTDGGGIVNGHAMTFLYNTTVVGNDADHDRDENGGIGGGVFAVVSSGARFGVVNSLIANNTILNAPIDDDCNGTLEAYGRNLVGTTTGCMSTNMPLYPVAVSSIGQLRDNGGPTWTHALLAGSAAIDGAIGVCGDETGAPLAKDQRQANRIAGVRCDVGAYEFGAVVDAIFRHGFQ